MHSPPWRRRSFYRSRAELSNELSRSTWAPAPARANAGLRRRGRVRDDNDGAAGIADDVFTDGSEQHVCDGAEQSVGDAVPMSADHDQPRIRGVLQQDVSRLPLERYALAFEARRQAFDDLGHLRNDVLGALAGTVEGLLGRRVLAPGLDRRTRPGADHAQRRSTKLCLVDGKAKGPVRVVR